MNLSYSTDLTDTQWQLLEPLLLQTDPTKGGRPRLYTHREILNAIFYIEKTGCQWRMLPREFPHWGLVWQYFRKWRDDGTLERVRLALNQKVRCKSGKVPLPSVALVDSQSVKTALKGGRGFDGGKGVKGRKRHLLTDTLGLLWARQVTAANVSDTAGFHQLLLDFAPLACRLLRVYVDRGYAVSVFAWLLTISGGRCLLERVQPVAGQVGFAVQPKRWIVERTIAWLSWSRRSSKDYEQTTTSSQAWIDVSAIRCTLRKLEKD